MYRPIQTAIGKAWHSRAWLGLVSAIGYWGGSFLALLVLKITNGQSSYLSYLTVGLPAAIITIVISEVMVRSAKNNESSPDLLAASVFFIWVLGPIFFIISALLLGMYQPNIKFILKLYLLGPLLPFFLFVMSFWDRTFFAFVIVHTYIIARLSRLEK